MSKFFWPDGAPGAKGDDVIDRPALTIHPAPAGVGNGAAVIVNPGGGYRILASDHEGLQVAHWRDGLKGSLENVGANIFVADRDLTLRYMNRRAE